MIGQIAYINQAHCEGSITRQCMKGNSAQLSVNISVPNVFHLRASFTKQGKLARERNSKRALMGVEISAGDLLTTRKLKNTDATSHLHIDQCNSDARVGFFSNPRVPLLWNYLAGPSPPRTTVSIFTTRPAPHPRPLNRHTRHCNVNENSLYFSLKVLGNIAL